MTAPKPSARTRKPAAEDLFSFEHAGQTYTFEKPLSVVRAPRWVRENRRRDELDLMWTIVETVAGDDALAAIDTMSETEFDDLMKQLERDQGALR